MDEFELVQIQELEKDIEVLQARYQANKNQIRGGINDEQNIILENCIKNITAKINAKKDEINQLKNKNEIVINTLTYNQNQFNTEINVDKNILKNKLMILNYQVQTRSFEDFWNIDNNPQIGSFVIQGERKGCHRWLVNRLIHQHFPDAMTSNKFIITLDRETYIEDLWKKLAKTLTRNGSDTPQQLIKRVYEYWQQETVILVFYNLDRMYKTEPKKLIEQFWCPLVKLVQKHPDRCCSYLAMFLVNHTGCSNEWEIDCVENLNIEFIDRPIMLSPIENFSQILIQNWIRQNRNNFPQLLPEINQVNAIARDIWEESFQGMPELAIEKLCNRCGTSFYEISKLLDL